jgi:hypothetical protein
VLESVDGDTLWFSRLAPDAPGITTPYQVEYARWIPGDPFEALCAVLVFACEGDIDAVSNALIEAIGSSGLEASADRAKGGASGSRHASADPTRQPAPGCRRRVVQQ